MLETLLVFAIVLIPQLFSVWIIRRIEARTRAKLRQAMHTAAIIRTQRHRTNSPLIPDRYYLEGVGYLIGDISCRFNARCGYLRCAVNPQGPCEGCRHYEAKEEL